MNRAHTLATRTFLFSFVPLCFALIGSFIAVHAAIRIELKRSLKRSLYQTEAAINKTESVYKRNAAQILAVLSENPGLKAAIGLIRESSDDAAAEDAVRRTIQASLSDLASGIEYDFLAVSDPRRRPLAAISGKDGYTGPLDNLPAPGESRLISATGGFFETMTAPINLEDENLGALTYGRKLDLSSIAQAGQVALIRNEKVVAATIPHSKEADLTKQLQAHRFKIRDGLEIKLAGEEYIVLELEGFRFGGGYQLLSLQSLDAALAQFTGSLGFVLAGVGAGGLALVLLLSATGSRSTAQPLTRLIEHLKRSGASGRLQPDFQMQSQVTEVNLLSRAFNEAAESVRESQEKLEAAYVQFVETMAEALDARDPYTAGHSRRVSAYSTMIGEAMNLNSGEAETLRTGAQLHDIGKIGVPDAVLQKPGALTDAEFATIKLHPEIGKRILEKLGRFAAILPIVELHHENHNGSGYPHGMNGEQVPLAARIVHVADAYDAMTTDRAYRKALPRERVLAELRKHAGQQFDPAVVNAFICILIGSNSNEMLHDENLERLGRALAAPAHEHTLAGSRV